MSNNAKKNTLKHRENTNKTCFEAFWEILEIPVLGSKMWFSAQISNYAKIPWNTQKTPTKHVLRLFKTKHALRHFKNFLKIRFLAEKSGSRLRCRIMLKIPWNSQKTPPEHVLILNNLLAMVRCLGQPTLFIILQMICTDQNWGSC